MKNYVIASKDGYSNRLNYYSYCDGSIRLSDVTEAKRFSYDELLEFLKEHPSFFSMGCTVIRIEDVTFEVFKSNPALVEKYNTLEYAIP